MSAVGRFAERVAVVVGGTSGIGLATARRLRDEGATVVIAGRRDGGAEAASSIGERVSFQRADVVDREQIDALFTDCVARHGRLDVVVNSAGFVVVAPTMSLKDRHWQRVIDVNLTGVFHVCQSAVPHLRATVAGGLARDTAIVNVLSIDAVAADIGMAAYNAAKAGALNFTRSFALEVIGDGIRINAVSPALVDTPMASTMTGNPEASAAFLAAIPAGRFGRPDDVAAAIAFLAAEEASFIVGENLMVDGGVTLRTGHPSMLAFLPPR